MLKPLVCNHQLKLSKWLSKHCSLPFSSFPSSSSSRSSSSSSPLETFASSLRDNLPHSKTTTTTTTTPNKTKRSKTDSGSSSSNASKTTDSLRRSREGRPSLADVLQEREKEAEEGVIGDKKWISEGGFPADLTAPHKQYPLARRMKRRIIYHAGPTNSGKTRAALNALKKAENGIYAAPLRLLAWEVYEKLNAEDTPCNLLTGQESEIGVGQHLACTVEMADTDMSYECAVIDEIQMLGDAERGWAWTRAVLGLAAGEVHVCGDESAEALVRAMCKQCGDTFEIHHYQRLLPLKIGPSLSSMKWQARPGDCFVGFSRKDLYGIRHDLEKARNDLEISLVYGSLPPETRRKQASQFNASFVKGDKHKVLVATDAIGMGLNLNIGRIVFTSIEKYDGHDMRVLTQREIKQIAGRAGRYGKGHECGEVVCMDKDDTDFVRANLDASLAPLERAGIFPSSEQLQAFHDLPDDPSLLKKANKKKFLTGFAGTLQRFQYAAILSNLYSLCHSEQMIEIAKLLDRVPELTLRERYIYCMAPVSTNIPQCMMELVRYAKAHVEGGLGEEFVPEVPQDKLQYQGDLLALEVTHKILDMYQWLARRFPLIYHLQETGPIVQERQADVCRRLEKGLMLSALSWKRRVRRK